MITLHKTEYMSRNYNPGIRALLHKLKAFLKYGQAANSNPNISYISFPYILSEILIENRLREKYPLVRYQFNLLNSQGFYSDYNSTKIVLKHLLINAFHLSSFKENAIVNISVNCNDQQSTIEIWSNRNVFDKKDPKNFTSCLFKGIAFSEGALARLSLVKKALKKLEGKLNIAPTPDAGTMINVVLPDLSL